MFEGKMTSGCFSWQEDDRFLDPLLNVRRTKHNLPHWEQTGRIQYITFRLADSLPQNVLLQLANLQTEFKSIHPEPWNKDTRIKYKILFSDKREEYLHVGYGSCIFKDPSIRKIMEDALQFYDGIKYDLLAYVIMPNHVHILIQPEEGNECKTQIGNIKRFVAHQVNKILSKKGKVFSESWDRIIRNESHLNSVLSYIYFNPNNLPKEVYSLGGHLIENATFEKR